MASGRGWLESTRDVIGLASSGRQSPSPIAREQAIHRIPSTDSAASRGRSGNGAQSVKRVPSWDALNRSIHNDSGHGKSTAQIIKDLRASNSNLTNKMAEMEADFMNQMNQMTMKTSKLEDSIETKNQEIKAFESRTLSTEKRIRDRDTQLTELKEENAFQRHTISDLKNQMYQLQHDIEEAEYDKQDEIQKWEEKVKDAERKAEQAEKAKERELNDLRQRSNEMPESNDIRAEELQKQLENMEIKLLVAEERATDSEKLVLEAERRAAKSEARAAEAEERVAEAEKCAVSSSVTIAERDGQSVTSDDKTVLHSWSQLDALQEDLDKSKKQLQETKSLLANVENENRRLIIDSTEKEMRLREKLETLHAEKSEMERDLRLQIKASDCGAELDDLRSEGKKKDDNIESLREQVRLYQDEIKAVEAEWKIKLDKSKSDQSLYEEDTRREMEAKVNDREKKISDLNSFINERDEIIESLNEKVEQNQEEIKSLNLKLEEVQVMAKKESAERPALLEEIDDQTQEIARQKAEITDLKNLLDEKTEKLNKLTMEVTELTDINEVLQSEMSDLRKKTKASHEEAEQAMVEAEKKSRSREAELEKELTESRTELASFERTLCDKTIEHDEYISDLKKEIEEISQNMLESESKHKRRISILETELSELEQVRDKTMTQMKEEQTARALAEEEESKLVQSLRSEFENSRIERSKVEEELKRQLLSVKNTNAVVLSELESELEEKVASAETYQRDAEVQKEKIETLATELEQLRISSKEDMDELRGELETTKSRLEDEKRDAEDRSAKLEAERLLWETREKDLENDKKAMEAQIDEYQRGQLELKEHIATLKHQMQAMEDNSQDVAETKKQLREAQLELMTMENEKIKNDKESKETESALRVELANAQEKMASLETKYLDEINELEQAKESMVQGYVVDIAQKEDMISRLNLAVSAQEQRVSGISSELEAVTQKHQMELKRYEDENEKLRCKITSLQKDVENVELSSVKDLTVELNAIKAALRHKENELAETRSALNAQRKRYHTLADPPLSQADSEDIVERGVEISLDEDLSFSKLSEEHAEKEAKLNGRIVSLENQISLLEDEKNDLVAELRGKLDDRDTTISALVKSSVTQEQKLSKMKAEVNRLKSQCEGDARNAAMQNNPRGVGEQEQLESLRKEIDSYRKVEEGLSKELSFMKRDLRAAKSETMRLRSELEQSHQVPRSQGKIDDSEDQMVALRKEKEQMVEEHKRQIRERDEAINTLVKSSVTQEKRVTKLQSEFEDLKKKGAKTESGPSWKELRRLQQESEIFASQIIEQDKEIDTLKTTLNDRNRSNSALRKEVSTLKTKLNSMETDAANLADLKAHLEEVKSDNARQREELREMRKRVRDADSQSVRIKELESEMADAKASLKEMESKIQDQAKQEERENSLRKDLDDAIESKESMEERLTRQIESLRRLRNHAIEDHEERLREKDKMIERMEEEAQKQGAKIVSLRNELREMRMSMNENPQADEEATMKEAVRMAKAELHEEMGMVELKNEALNKEIENLKDQIKNMAETREKDKIEAYEKENESLKKKLERLESENMSSDESKNKISELKAQLDEAEKERASFEKNAISTFERKMSLMQLNKDLTIDNLRKELAVAKEKQSDKEIEQLCRIQSIEKEYREFKENSETEIQQKDSKIFALQQTLDAQGQVVGNMGSEMDQLQNSMEKESLRRRAEVEELEREVVESSAKATRLERKITELKMKNEERKLRHNDEVEKLKQTISTLEKESPLARGVQAQRDDHRIEELNEKMEKVKWRNSSLQEENLKLRERIEKYDVEDRTSKNDKWRNAALQEQVAILTKKNHELENALVSMSSRGTSKRTSQSPAPRRAPEAPRRVSESPMRSRTPPPKVPMSPMNSTAASNIAPSPARSMASRTSPSRSGSRNTTPRSSPMRRGLGSLMRRKSKDFSKEDLQVIGNKDEQSTHTDFTF